MADHIISVGFVLVDILNNTYNHRTNSCFDITMYLIEEKNQCCFYLRISLRGRPQMLG